MKNIKIGTRLFIGFLTILIFMAAVGIIGIDQMKNLTERITKFYNHPFTVSTSVREVNTQVVAIHRAMKDVALSKNDEQIDLAIKDVSERENVVYNNFEIIRERYLGDQQMVENAYNAFKDWKAIRDEVIQLMKDDERDKAAEITKGKGVAQVELIEETLTALDDFAMEKAASFKETAIADSNNMIKVVAIVLGAALLIAIMLSVLIISSITKPIKEVTSVAESISKGDIQVKIEKNSKDEIGDLMSSFSKMLDGIKQQSKLIEELSKGNLDVRAEVRSDNDMLSMSLNNIVMTLSKLINEMNNMSQQHDLGDIDITIDTNLFTGPYKVVAQSVNDMVNGHIEMNRKAMACVEAFGKGNFDAELEQFPGKKAVINDIIETLRANLKKVNTEIRTLVEKSVKGELSIRAEASEYEGDWNKLTSGINQLLEAIIEPIKEARLVLGEMSKGNLSARIEGDYQGDHAEIKNALNSMGAEIQGYIEELTNILSDMANKNFRGEIEREYLGDFVKLKDSINHILEQFNSMLSEINASAEQVEAGADQVASSSQNLSQGSSEQAGSVEEISATITQVAEQAKENTVNANKANELSINAKTDAQNGDAQMAEMLKAMNEIKESSKNISNIIKVIDEIAFQTNILALNAAVEAARAGEHGKGFAVVAEEVRNLAARSAQAAKETTDLIDNSINKVEEGYKMANDTAKALGKIVTGATNAVEIVGMIANASNEQANAIGEVNQGIEQISHVTQSNTATAEESASASEEMAGQAQMLKVMMQAFKLKNTVTKKLTENTTNIEQLEAPENNEMDFEVSLNDNNSGKY
ncbi:MAG: methyl-accepting chemotaxis protein [Clostridia bacterium]|nr:methyl-accepting chemotaxis protein [Clostridia bacterium]